MKSILKKYRHFLKYPLDDADINQIFIYAENSQIKKLHYEYGTAVLLTVLKYYEEKQDFERCFQIKSFLEAVQKYSEEKIPQDIDQWTGYSR